jgi:hypothetical protein
MVAKTSFLCANICFSSYPTTAYQPPSPQKIPNRPSNMYIWSKSLRYTKCGDNKKVQPAHPQALISISFSKIRKKPRLSIFFIYQNSNTWEAPIVYWVIHAVMNPHAVFIIKVFQVNHETDHWRDS